MLNLGYRDKSFHLRGARILGSDKESKRPAQLILRWQSAYAPSYKNTTPQGGFW